MKKQKKKLTPRQKEELKAKLKKATLTMLHIISYICTALFVLVCVVACIQSCNTKKKSSNATPQQNNAPVVSRALEPQRASEEVKPEASDRYFYPSDIDLGNNDDIKLAFKFSNYNYLSYFLPSVYDLTHYNADIYTYIDDVDEGYFFYYLDYISLNNPDNGYLFDNVRYTQLYLYVSLSSYDVFISDSVGNYDIWLYTMDNNGFTYNTDIFDNFFDIFDDIFSSGNHTIRKQRIGNSQTASYKNAYKQVFNALAYYLSDKSFDYNAYVFGGLEKYVSFMSLFRRVYNGFFVYYPNHTDLYYTKPLFKGVWEYKNVIYDTIEITIQRAWNGTYVNNNITYTYDVTYVPPANNIHFFNDIFNGDSEALTNYYFIRNIEMVSVHGERVTLAYNRVSGSANATNFTATYLVFPSNNLRLWADDSFLNNNNIEFVLYSIDYDYSFNMDSNLFTIYKAYADFFFSAFYYTGLYHTTKPNVSDNDIQVLVPVISMLALALTGMLPLLNVYLLPGVSLGTLLALPFIVSIILFVVKLFKR